MVALHSGSEHVLGGNVHVGESGKDDHGTDTRGRTAGLITAAAAATHALVEELRSDAVFSQAILIRVTIAYSNLQERGNVQTLKKALADKDKTKRFVAAQTLLRRKRYVRQAGDVIVDLYKTHKPLARVIQGCVIELMISTAKAQPGLDQIADTYPYSIYESRSKVVKWWKARRQNVHDK